MMLFTYNFRREEKHGRDFRFITEILPNEGNAFSNWMQTVLPAHRLVANTSHVNYIGVEYNKDKKGIRDGPSVHSIKGKMSGCYCVDNQKDGECDT